MTHAWATIIPTRVEYLDCIVFGKRKPFTPPYGTSANPDDSMFIST